MAAFWAGGGLAVLGGGAGPANKTWQIIDTANRSPATPGLPIGLEAGLSGQHAAAVGELAVEAAEQRDIVGGRELRSEIDARRISRRARAVDRERRARQRDEP